MPRRPGMFWAKCISPHFSLAPFRLRFGPPTGKTVTDRTAFNRCSWQGFLVASIASSSLVQLDPVFGEAARRVAERRDFDAGGRGRRGRRGRSFERRDDVLRPWRKAP